MSDKPHLTLVNPASSADYEAEFAPLPAYNWDERPITIPLESDAAATALYLSQGRMPAAARLLKVPEIRLKRLVKGSPRLQRIRDELADLVVDRAWSEYIDALEAPDDRRREWGATKIMQSKTAQASPWAPAPAANIQSNSLTVESPARRVVYRWRTGNDGDGIPADLGGESE